MISSLGINMDLKCWFRGLVIELVMTLYYRYSFFYFISNPLIDVVLVCFKYICTQKYRPLEAVAVLYDLPWGLFN